MEENDIDCKKVRKRMRDGRTEGKNTTKQKKKRKRRWKSLCCGRVGHPQQSTCVLVRSGNKAARRLRSAEGWTGT